MKTLFIFSIYTLLIFAQNNNDKTNVFSYDLGADIVSRYVWRGMEFGGNTPHIQPWGQFNIDLNKLGGFSLGFWASYGFASENSQYSENDIYLKYFNNFDFGTITISINDYYYPFLGKFSNFKDNGLGSHTFELGVSYDGNEKFPIHFLVSNNIFNQSLFSNGNKEKTFYFQFGYKFKIDSIELFPILGFAQGQSIWHQINSDKFEIINFAINSSKIIKITNDFSIPVSISWILNPYSKTTFTVLKISI